MIYTITLVTHDNKEFKFSCAENQTVQAAAEAAGIYPPAICKMGSCGACQAHCEQGEYHLDTYNPGLLPENAAEQGAILLCRLYPHTDLRIATPYSSASVRIEQTKPRDARILSVQKIAERTMRLVLQLVEDPMQGLRFEFEPGQYVEIEIPTLGLKRAYSLSNTPNWDAKLEFLVRLQPQGVFSSYLLEQARVGDWVSVYPAAGTFTLSSQNSNPRCFVAGGTGLAPFMSMLRRMAEWNDDHPTQLFFGVNTEEEIFFQAELEALQHKLSNLHINICVWQAGEDWIDFRGTPAEALARYLDQVDILPDLFLCGPAQLVDVATQVALTKGISPDRIYCERFG